MLGLNSLNVGQAGTRHLSLLTVIFNERNLSTKSRLELLKLCNLGDNSIDFDALYAVMTGK